MLKIIIADDDEIIRSRLVKKIDWESMGYEVVAEATDGKDLLDKTEVYHPDVVLTDIKMPFMSGIEYVEAVKKGQLQPEIVIITGYAEFEYVRKLLHLGVYGYILKPLDKEELRECMCKLQDKILHDREVKKLVSGRDNQGMAENKKQGLPEALKQELVDKFMESRAVEVMALVEDYHGQMCMKEIPIYQMKQNYMHLFNAIYRRLKDADRVDDEIKGLMLTLFEDCFSELSTERELHGFIRSLLERLFGCLHAPEREMENIHLQKALNYIDKYFMRNISMAEVANQIGVSYGYLSYILNESVEGGFVRILRNRRIKEAKKLLAGSELKIYDIAEQCGFANSRYFGTMFYADTGMTPTEYRKKNFRGVQS